MKNDTHKVKKKREKSSAKTSAHARKTDSRKRKKTVSNKPKNKVAIITENEFFGKSMITVSIIIVVIMLALIYFLNKESLNPRLKSGGDNSSLSDPKPGFTSQKYFEENDIEPPLN